jgi:transposase
VQSLNICTSISATSQSGKPSGCEKTNTSKSLRYAKKMVFLSLTNILHQMPLAAKLDRFQFHFSSLEESITCDNPVRFLDAFVDKLEMEKLQFSPLTIKIEGRPAFEPQIFLKLYLYGYLNGIRSSRKLERECVRNIELQWLLSGQRPNYHSIADFRKVNSVALQNTFKLFVLFLKEASLLGVKLSPLTVLK